MADGRVTSGRIAMMIKYPENNCLTNRPMLLKAGDIDDRFGFGHGEAARLS